MNKQIAKEIRKWAELRELDYDICKKMYKDLSVKDKARMRKEVRSYIDAVADKRIIPGRPHVAL